MDFDKAFKLVVGAEGGFTNDPDDNGNWTGGRKDSGELMGTKFGIAANTYGKELKKRGRTIKDLSLEDAKLFYKRDWWDQLKCDLLPGKFRYPLFSAAINCGLRVASIWLQECVGAKPDGCIGPNTCKAAECANTDWALNGFYERWLKRYNVIVQNKPIMQKYLNGWRNRVAEVKEINNKD